MNKPRPHAWWHQHKANLGAFLIILLVFVLMFRRALFAGEFLLWGDPICYSLPLRTLAWGMIRQGQLPLWTPHIFAGYPLLSMAVIAIGYPLTWGYLFLPGYWAEQIYILAPYLLAPTFTYAYCREIKLSHLASVLAGLSFGYGGLMFSPIGLNGMLPNAVMWLPLMLIAIERAEKQKFLRCLLLSTFAYTMSVLTGIGQGFVYIGVIAFFYAVFYSLFLPSLKVTENDSSNHRKILYRLRPVGIVVSSALLAAGVAAFQILETSHAARYSVRRTLTYENFTTGSLSLWAMIKGWLEPINPPSDVTPWVSTLSIILSLSIALTAIFRSDLFNRKELSSGLTSAQSRFQKVRIVLRNYLPHSKINDPRIFFWTFTAGLALLLMLGSNTVLYKVLYYIPFINKFRVPSRHSIEWTFSVGILAGYGWDLAGKVITVTSQTSQKQKTLTGFLLALTTATAFLWWRSSLRIVLAPDDWLKTLHSPYLLWKAGLTVLVMLILWQGWRTSNSTWRTGTLIAGLIVSTTVEPLIILARVSPLLGFTRDQVNYISPSSQFLQNLQPDQNRVYPFADWSTGGETKHPKIDWLNRHILFSVQSVSGYEPLLPKRYSVALGNGNWDVVSEAPALLPERSLFTEESHTLNILNTTHIVALQSSLPSTLPTMEKEGITFLAEDTPLRLKTETITTLKSPGSEATEIVLVTSLSDSPHLSNKTPVARVGIRGHYGEYIEFNLHAGIDTAEWAYDRPDVRQKIRHQRASIFQSFPGDAKNTFQSHHYWTRLKLGKRLKVRQVELQSIVSDATVELWRAATYDTMTLTSCPLSLKTIKPLNIIWQRDGVVIGKNDNALPRTWLVAEAEAVDGVQALQAIRGETNKPFDPRKTALLETTKDKLPALSGGLLSPLSTARIANYEPNRLLIETEADKAAVLVVSESSYPEWEATVDGAKTKIFTTDFLLRGVYVPAGRHRVEMRYVPTHAFRGAIISILSLIFILGLMIKSQHR